MVDMGNDCDIAEIFNRHKIGEALIQRPIESEENGRVKQYIRFSVLAGHPVICVKLDAFVATNNAQSGP